MENHGDETKPLTTTLAEYVTATRLEDIPEETRHKGLLCILDTVGCMIAGSRNDVGRIYTSHALAHAKDGPATVFGVERSVDVEAAAFANAGLAHVLELDDGHRPSDNHLGCAVVPGAIAAAQYVGASGAELLRAVILGYDVMGRIGQAVCRPRRPRTPFHHTGTTAGFGSAAAAGVLLGLSTEQLAQALGIAATGGAGLREVMVSGADCKSFQVARGTFNGVNAALMAQAGLTGPVYALEGEYGFIAAVGGPMPQPELITQDLGTRFAVSESAFKVHAVCGMLFTPIDAAIELRRQHDLVPAEIESVSVSVPSWVETDSIFGRPRPETPGQARFSVPFGVAAAFKDGEVSPVQISDEGIHDQEIADLESKVTLDFTDSEVQRLFDTTKDDDYFFHPAAVTVQARGTSYRQLEPTPRGYDPARGLTEAEVLAKFRSSAGSVVGADVAAALIDQIMGLEDADHVTGLQGP
jgi:2-methylcitrate dehydratase PrpD